MASDEDNGRYDAAEYRVRLFLSVDLSGSTAFKNSKDGAEVDVSASPRWVNVFQKFYSGFPEEYQSTYQRSKNGMVGDDTCPSLWKAVGDELVFCGTVSNKKAVSLAILAFIDTLHAYRKRLQDQGHALNLKGAAWLAAFPEPNRAVQLRTALGQPEYFTASEALERAADATPHEFDFLGKAIDTGFRVASTASTECFALSVQLARLLVGLAPGFGFDHDIRFAQPIALKGVNGGEPYPRLYIDTMTYLPSEEVRKKERALLKTDVGLARNELLEYLKVYSSVVGTDEIILTDTAQCDKGALILPDSYLKSRDLITSHFEGEIGRGEEEQIATDEGGLEILAEAEEMKPLDS